MLFWTAPREVWLTDSIAWKIKKMEESVGLLQIEQETFELCIYVVLFCLKKKPSDTDMITDMMHYIPYFIN